MALKVADCGHCCTPLKQHIRWVYRLQEEFFLQVSYSHSNSHSHSYCPAQAAHPLGVRPAGGVLPPGEFQSQTQSLRHGHSGDKAHELGVPVSVTVTTTVTATGTGRQRAGARGAHLPANGSQQGWPRQRFEP
eukprot:195093-Prorocentrum_minimum.AAC.1